MKFIELTMCSTKREKYNNIIINIDSIIRIDNAQTTQIWLQEFDSYICVLESYDYLKYELTNCERIKESEK